MKIIDTIALQQLPKVGKKTAKGIVSRLPDNITTVNWDSIFEQLCSEGMKLPNIGKSDIDAAYDVANEIMHKSALNNIDIIHYQDEKYPLLLNSLSDAPLIIYTRGNHSILNGKKSVAVIGTREPTDYGLRIGKRISQIFAEEQYVVVSGLAKGCDTAAHEGCLAGNGKTVAVMPGGVDKIYPKENTALANSILEKDGCLVSEYPIGQKVFAGNFVERDRIQSGLSEGVVVIETDIKGGTLHTVKFAQDQKRAVACISDHPEKYREHSKTQGNKKLLQEGIAKPISSRADIQAFMKSMDNGIISVLIELKNNPVMKMHDSLSRIIKMQKFYERSLPSIEIIDKINSITAHLEIPILKKLHSQHMTISKFTQVPSFLIEFKNAARIIESMNRISRLSGMKPYREDDSEETA